MVCELLGLLYVQKGILGKIWGSNDDGILIQRVADHLTERHCTPFEEQYFN
jgi:hypothetical protein